MRILTVDDSPLTRRVVRRFLNDLGFLRIDEAANGAAAIELLNETAFELIVSDWNMAPVNGLELLRHVRADPRTAKTPFIMATALSAVKYVDVARDNGATCYIVKPFNAASLGAKIDAALRSVTMARHAAV